MKSATSRIDESADNRLHEGAIKREIGLRHAVNRGETVIIRHVVAAQCADVIERPQLAPHDPFAGSEIGIDRFTGLPLEFAS